MSGTEMGLKEFVGHLPSNHKVRAELYAIANTVALLNSMVNAGEGHSHASKKEVKQALYYIRGF